MFSAGLLSSGAWAAPLPSAPVISGTSTDTAVTLSWSAPASGSAITDYIVQHRLAGGSSWSTLADGSSDSPGATVTGLNHNSSYQFRVAAVSPDGTGSYSSILTVATKKNFVLALSGSSPSFILSGSAVPVDSSLTITDETSNSISVATVRISSGLQTGDTLALPSGAGYPDISGSYDSGNGRLTLSGAGNAADYQAALRAVTFSTTNTAISPRTIEVTLGNAASYNGHFYEVVRTSALGGWPEARSVALARSYFGIPGYLANVTSAGENAFLVLVAQTDVFVGGSDQDSEGVWKWMDGPEAGTIFWNGPGSGSAPAGQYANWNPASGEPNGGTGENHLALTTSGKWNDYSGPGPYLIEYGNPDAVITFSGTKTLNVSISLDFQVSDITGYLSQADGWSSNDPVNRPDGYATDTVNTNNILGLIGGKYSVPAHETTQLTYSFNPGNSDRYVFQWNQNIRRSEVAYPGDDIFGWKFMSGNSTAFSIRFLNDSSTGRDLLVQGYDGTGTALSLAAGQSNDWYIDRDDANDFRVTADLATRKWALDVFNKSNNTWFGLVANAAIAPSFASLSGMAATWTVADNTFDTTAGQYLGAGNNFMAFDNITIQGKQTVAISLNLTTNAVYNGSARTISPTTTPSGVQLIVRYNGSTNAPTDAGTYVVTAEVVDTNSYYNAPTSGTFVVAKATPTITTNPTASPIFLGQALSSSTLSGGSATGVGGVPLTGSFAFTLPSSVPSRGTPSVSVTFTPTDTNYFTTTANIQVTVLSLGTPWDAWADSRNLTGSDRSPSADPDQDGFSNAQEFAFGTDPQARTMELFSASMVGSDYVVTFKKRILTSDATYEFRSSTDLSQLFSAGTLLTPTLPTSVDADYEQVTVKIPMAGERGFIRGQANVLVGPTP
ncbi:MAG: hypothetical protein EBT50_05765 [Verrucomicrobia bacterium]|nr:hypothetical protein [Verrucomicrobiota bacterium]